MQVKSLIPPPIARLASTVRHRAKAKAERLHRIFVVKLLIRTAHELSADDATHMAAGLAYYGLFSLFPLLLGLTSILSFFVDPDTIGTRLTEFAGGYLPGAGELVEENVDAVLRLRGALSVFAVLGLLWSGSAMFGAISRSVNRAWDVHVDRPFFISKPRQLAMALGVAILFFLSVGSAGLARVAGQSTGFQDSSLGFMDEIFGLVILHGSSLFFTVSIFLLVYKYMPNTKTYWRYVWPGAVVAAALFETAKNGFLLYLDQFANFESVYGSLSPVIALLVWAYVSGFILIVGAELSSEYGRLREGVDRGTLIHAHE